MRVLLVCLTALLGLCAATLPAAAEKRIALVIGNSEYAAVSRLDNPMNDANLVAATLQSVGFKLVGEGPLIDLSKAGFDRAVQTFSAEMTGADVALFFFAGHGVQVRGNNYLIPVDANPTRETDVDFQMFDVNVVLRQMEGARTRLNIVILDACRNNPFGGRGLRATGGGLAQMQAPEGTLISFATQPGNVALDGSDGHSPYSKALARALRQPGLDLFQTFNAVGLAVKTDTNGSQLPWVANSPISGSFYFNGGPGGTAVAAAVQSPAPPKTAHPAAGSWQGIAAVSSTTFGGPPFCKYKVTLRDLNLAATVSDDGIVTEARLIGSMEETTVGDCAFKTIPTHLHVYNGTGGVADGKVTLRLRATAKNQPQADVTFNGKLSQGRLIGTLLLKRNDIGGTLAWSVQAVVK